MLALENQEKCNEKLDMCSEYAIHQDTLSYIHERALNDSTVNDLADFFKMFGDPTRLRILHALSVAEMCVCDLCEYLGMNQPAVSHQLKILRHGRLIKHRREGRNVYYSLDDEHIEQIMKVGLEHLMESK